VPRWTRAGEGGDRALLRRGADRGFSGFRASRLCSGRAGRRDLDGLIAVKRKKVRRESGCRRPGHGTYGPGKIDFADPTPLRSRAPGGRTRLGCRGSRGAGGGRAAARASVSLAQTRHPTPENGGPIGRPLGSPAKFSTVRRGVTMLFIMPWRKRTDLVRKKRRGFTRRERTIFSGSGQFR